MTKTQAELLARAAQNRSGCVATMHGCYTGARSGSFGGRESDAACKLRDAGLIERIRGYASQEIINRGWTTVHTYENVWKITEAGRAVLTA